ncbi:MAG: class I SAM-dependent methyltransferase [candidate division WOR-3 bacterium]
MSEELTFDFNLFPKLKEAEYDYFWFEVRRKWIFDKINKLKKPPAKLLEIGCGTGNISSHLSLYGYSVVGCDYYIEGLKLAWPGFKIVCGDARNLPFRDESFDIVGLFDVIEHFEDDLHIIEEAKRVLNTKGFMVLTVPAQEELWSEFDISVFHKRRYTKKKLKELLLKAHLKIISIEYMFMFLYLPIKYIRNKNPNLDTFKINKYLNKFLKIVFNFERKISKFWNLPIGTSLIAIAQK